jgi:hemerythrin-like domain-containing protein
MTKYLTMNTVIHAAVRRDLDRFDQALDALSPGDQRRADQLWTAWQNYTAQLHGHHEDEETIFWPVLSDLGANEALVSDLDGEHEGMLAAMNRADTAMAALASDASAENTKTAQVAVLEHRHVTLEHLAHEERDLEPFAASHIGSPQMKAALVKVRKAHRGRAGTSWCPCSCAV